VAVTIRLKLIIDSATFTKVRSVGRSAPVAKQIALDSGPASSIIGVRKSKGDRISEQLERSKESLPEPMARKVKVLTTALEQWELIAQERRQQVPEPGNERIVAMQEIHRIWESLDLLLEQMLIYAIEHRIQILQTLADSADPTVRFMSARHLEVAYFESPEDSRPLITQLLTDPDPRVRDDAHHILQHYANDLRDPMDTRDIIPFDYLQTLPIHELSVDPQGEFPIVVRSDVETRWWPTN